MLRPEKPLMLARQRGAGELTSALECPASEMQAHTSVGVGSCESDKTGRRRVVRMIDDADGAFGVERWPGRSSDGDELVQARQVEVAGHDLQIGERRLDGHRRRTSLTVERKDRVASG